MDTQRLAETVRKARRALDMSQTQLGNSMGKSRAWVTRIEANSPGTYRAMTAQKWAELEHCLQLTMGSLLAHTGIPMDEWPDLAQESMAAALRSEGLANSRWVFVGDLTRRQAKIVAELAGEFRRLNSGE